MSAFIIRRLRAMIFLLFGISIIVFGMLHMIPGDPAQVMAGVDASTEDVEVLRRELGLDRPLPIQYIAFLKRILTGDFGDSIKTNRPVITEIRFRFPATVELATAALLLALFIGIPAGVISAYWPRSWVDYVSMVGAVTGVSMPLFWLGLILMYVFAVVLGLFPVTGRGTWRHLVLPALTLCPYTMAIIARMTRSSMLEILNLDYIRSARAKGVSELRLVCIHALKNALPPVITVAGLQFGYLLAGTVITETVFAWPGIGKLIVDALAFRDYPVIQASVLLVASTFVVVNAFVDVSYAMFDRRITLN